MFVIVSNKTENNTKKVKKFVNTLSKEDKDYIGSGYWVDSDHVISRAMVMDGPELYGFADCYQLPKYPGAGMIVLAVGENIRKKGWATKLVKQIVSAVKKKAKELDIRYLIFHVDKGNTKSKNLAEKLGFSYAGESKEHEGVLEYQLDLAGR